MKETETDTFGIYKLKNAVNVFGFWSVFKHEAQNCDSTGWETTSAIEFGLPNSIRNSTKHCSWVIEFTIMLE